MTKILISVFSLFVASFFMACNIQTSNEPLMVKTIKTFEGAYGQNVIGEQTWTLWAGQDIDAGTLTVANDSNTLYVTYKTLGTFGTLNLWVGTDISQLPKDEQGDLLLAKFPNVFVASGLNEFTFEIPFREIPTYKHYGDPLIVVANAEVSLDGTTEIGFGGDFEASAADQSYYYTKYDVR